MNSNESERTSHPSFGQIYFGRVSSSLGEDFYGSELKQDHYISMEVHKSEVERELAKEWYFTKGSPLIRLRMTSGQFSELITSLNSGSGIPCTIEYLNQEKVEEMPKQESRKEFVHRKFEERMKTFADSIRSRQAEAKDIVKKKTLSKDDVNKLNILLQWLTQEIESNIPFFAKCFQETMDKVVFEAKTEVENAIQHKINVLGLTELHKQNKLLSETNEGE